ncbi:MAG: succinate dehydrogenase, hydrophobic membrane anchor protein [Parvibaculum sp.]|nr:succinate dehydrogenase, hydrophobic membrane anchor protein [Parvibaculum sp.]
MSKQDMRTPLAKILHLGSAKSGTEDHVIQRATALAIAPLSVFAIVSVVALIGADYETARAYVGHPLISILLIALISAFVLHMRIGVKITIEDYVHSEGLKHYSLLANSFFSYGIGLACIYAALKIGFGS